MALTEGSHAGEFLLSEANGGRSRELITLLLGQNLKAGAVLGKVTTGSTATSAANAGNVGDGVMGAVTVSAGAKPGVYRLNVTAAAVNAGTFEVEDPDGVPVGVGTVGVAFSAGGRAFTLADGTTDFVVGDGFTITVAAGSGKFKEYNPANSDGSGVAAAVLWDNVDASAADTVAAAIARDAEVKKPELKWFTGASSGQIAAGLVDLAAVGIIGR